MEPSQIESIKRLSEQRLRAAELESTERPLGITLISTVQLLKGAVLLVTAILLRVKPELVNGPDSPLTPLLYVATRGRYDSISAALEGSHALPGLVLFLGFYLGAVGFGLLWMNAWARRTLILNSGVTLALWAKTTLSQNGAAQAAPDMTSFYVLLGVDAAVFLYLLPGSTAIWFQRRPDPRSL